MASNQTSHYALSQWSAEDRVLRAEFNADNEKIDRALAALAEETASKASQEEVTGLKHVVATKADQSELTALGAQVGAKAAQTDLDALKSTVDTKAGQAAVTTLQTNLSALQTAVNAKASQTDLSALQTTVNAKASQSELNSLKTTVNTKADRSEVTALRGEMAAGDLWVKVADFRVNSDCVSTSFDLSGIHFTDYWQVRIFCQFWTTGTAQLNLNHDLEWNYSQCSSSSGSSTSSYLFNLNYINSATPNFLELVSQIPEAGFHPVFYSNETGVNGKSFRQTWSSYSGCTWETLTSLDCTSWTSILAGSRVMIMGLKK